MVRRFYCLDNDTCPGVKLVGSLGFQIAQNYGNGCIFAIRTFADSLNRQNIPTKIVSKRLICY